VRTPPAIVCAAALLLAAPACTIGPAGGDDGGTSGSPTTTTRTLGDQCTSVLTTFCQKAGACAVLTSLSDCITGNMPLCCVGTACDATSTVSEDTVTACEQTIMAEDCNDVVNTNNPTTCLGSQ
jgi:hypothetical protein